MDPSLICNLLAIAPRQYIVIVAFRMFPSRQGGIRAVFPIIFPVYMDPGRGTRKSRAVIYLKYLLGPLPFDLFFGQGRKYPLVLLVVFKYIAFFITPILAPMLDHHDIVVDQQVLNGNYVRGLF